MMVIPVIIGILSSSVPGVSPGDAIVFAADRYVEHLGNVYQLGPTHLYTIQADGTYLRQLTTSESDDGDPSPSQAKGRILFWRQQGDDEHAKFALCSIGIDGSRLQRTAITVSDPTPGLAQAIERYGTKVIHETTGSKSRGLSIIGSAGKALVRDADLAFSPLCDAAIARIDSETGYSHLYAVVDLCSMEVYRCPGNLDRYVWVDNDTIAAVKPGLGSTIVLLNRRSKVVKQVAFTDASRTKVGVHPSGSSLFDPETAFGPAGVRSFAIRPKSTFLLQGHQSMSDGGFDYFSRIDLNKRNSGPLIDQTVEAVTPDGHRFLGAQYGWFGGYKGPGAKKLCNLYLWDAATMTNRPIGFKYMQCKGACFVPNPAK